MAWPRKGILIRLAIYLPIIGFFTYGAFFRDKEAPPESAQPAEPSVGKIRTMVGPDGQTIEYLEVTPDEAKQMGVSAEQLAPRAKPEPAEPEAAVDPKPAKSATPQDAEAK